MADPDSNIILRTTALVIMVRMTKQVDVDAHDASAAGGDAGDNGTYDEARDITIDVDAGISESMLMPMTLQPWMVTLGTRLKQSLRQSSS